ncbi:FAD-dependent oxidoreductase [Moorella sulfitireducens]|uniref:FAD-dependent oxidoreductase n=1 Tax=Neomoorella sulfitireducens TaxID=2972948 RepID=UPI0021ACA8D4|nr:FAD-binding protein [Moorella sulfitireducens]
MNTENLSCDLVIIGGGGSGLVAAVRAREMGVKDVVVLEKASRTGGNAWLAVVMFGLGFTSDKPADLQASIDDAFKTTMESGNWLIDARIVRTYLEKNPEVVKWLKDKGINFVTGGFELQGKKFQVLRMPTRQGGYRAKDPSRGPGFVGGTVVEAMHKECQRLGIKILTRTKANKILLDGPGFKASGVLASGPDKEYRINAKSVIIAAGGFGANDKMLRKYFPKYFEIDGPINTLCTRFSTGDGITMAEELGALIGEDMDAGIIGPGHHPWAYSVHETMLRPECIWVNKNGERFIDECASMMAGAALNKQPGAVLYALLDADIKRYIQENPNERQIAMGGLDWFATLDEDLEKEAARGKKVKIAQSWDEIASFIGVKPEVLKATVDRYNKFCDEGRDADFVKDRSFLLPLRTPPFYAILAVRFCHGTAGGIRINHRMEVIRRDGNIISGLYASGDNTSGWVTEWHIPGTTLAWAFTSGYMAGENAARYVLR